MTRLVKIIDNKYVHIEEYRNPNICFNTNEYSDFEDYCTLRKTFDPFRMFYENQQLKKQLEQYQEEVCILDMRTDENIKLINQQKEFIKYLEDYIKEMEEEIGNSMTEPYKKSHTIRRNVYQEILQKYKEIIGENKDEQ